MDAKSKIEWTDLTLNPGLGCTISRACKGRTLGMRLLLCGCEAKWSGRVGNHPRRRTTEAYWRNPLAWNCTLSVIDFELCAMNLRKKIIFHRRHNNISDEFAYPQIPKLCF